MLARENKQTDNHTEECIKCSGRQVSDNRLWKKHTGYNMTAIRHIIYQIIVISNAGSSTALATAGPRKGA